MNLGKIAASIRAADSRDSGWVQSKPKELQQQKQNEKYNTSGVYNNVRILRAQCELLAQAADPL